MSTLVYNQKLKRFVSKPVGAAENEILIAELVASVTGLQSYHYEPMVQLGFNDSVYYDPTQNKVPNFYTTPDGDIYVMKVSN